MSRKRVLWKFYAMVERERRHMLGEFVHVKGLMPLLMKPRNKQKWSAADKRELSALLGRVSRVSPYIAVIVLPVVAWWLDGRRGQRGLPQSERAG